MQIHTLKSSSKRKRRTRVGRGSTRGTTSGRGTKGQSSRSGGKSRRRGFEGGRTSLIQQLPKVRGKGFKRIRLPFSVVNLADLNLLDGVVDMKVLKGNNLIARKDRYVKVLGNGDLEKKLTVSAHAFSTSAKEKIEKAGGKVIVLPLPEKKGAKKKEDREKK